MPVATPRPIAMPTQIAAAEQGLTAWHGLWRWHPPAAAPLVAGISDRAASIDTLRLRLPDAALWVQAQQIHGASLAAVDPRPVSPDAPLPAAGALAPFKTETVGTPLLAIPGCDGLSTQTAGVALIIRTADCLPIFAWDPVGQVGAVMHAGWRGLSRHLPERLLRFLHTRYHCRAERLWIGIGPAIRQCCFEVGVEFDAIFGAFVRQQQGRRTCDLAGFAAQRFIRLGIQPRRLADCLRCTACDPAHWHSHRRDGDTGGRLFSFALIRP
jgi:YfiH family protein